MFDRENGRWECTRPDIAYNDVNWISITKDTKSMSGYVFMFGSADVSWKSSKHICIARSTMELMLINLD